MILFGCPMAVKSSFIGHGLLRTVFDIALALQAPKWMVPSFLTHFNACVLSTVLVLFNVVTLSFCRFANPNVPSSEKSNRLVGQTPSNLFKVLDNFSRLNPGVEKILFSNLLYDKLRCPRGLNFLKTSSFVQCTFNT